MLEFQNEDPCLYADATKEVKSTFHHCVVRLNQRFYSAFFEMKNGNLLDKKIGHGLSCYHVFILITFDLEFHVKMPDTTSKFS